MPQVSERDAELSDVADRPIDPSSAALGTDNEGFDVLEVKR